MSQGGIHCSEKSFATSGKVQTTDYMLPRVFSWKHAMHYGSRPTHSVKVKALWLGSRQSCPTSLREELTVCRDVHLHILTPSTPGFLDFCCRALHVAVNQPPLYSNTSQPSSSSVCRGGNHLCMRHLKPVVLSDSDTQEWGHIIRNSTNTFVPKLYHVSLSLSHISSYRAWAGSGFRLSLLSSICRTQLCDIV